MRLVLVPVAVVFGDVYSQLHEQPDGGIGLSLPGNGTILATHANRIRLFQDAARLVVENAFKYYEEGDESVLPKSIATRQAFLNAMTLDIAMGGSSNTVLHLLAVANEGRGGLQEADIDALSRKSALSMQVGAQHAEVFHPGM